jgi:hypothetical protein
MKNSLVFGKKSAQEYVVKPVTARRKVNNVLMMSQQFPSQFDPTNKFSYLEANYESNKDEYRPNSSIGPSFTRTGSPKKIPHLNSSNNEIVLTKTTPRRTPLKQDTSTIKKFHHICVSGKT